MRRQIPCQTVLNRALTNDYNNWSDDVIRYIRAATLGLNRLQIGLLLENGNDGKLWAEGMSAEDAAKRIIKNA